MKSACGIATIIAFVLGMYSVPQPSLAQTKLPTTEEFQSSLTSCAKKESIQIDEKIRGSFASVYDEASRFRLLTLTDFLSSLPEGDRLAGFKLYNECVLKILRRDLSETGAIPEVMELPSQIVTSGKELDIKAKILIANSTEIRAFRAGSRSPDGSPGANGANGRNGANGSGGAGGDGVPGGNGANGSNGTSAGEMIIEAEMLIGNLTILNNGTAGGNGGPGGVGGSGGAGGQGGSSSSGLFDCRRGPGNGGAGGNAGAGGDGGRGGNGGDGGTVLIKIGSVAEGSVLTVTSKGGIAGQPGNPGQAGSPGRGGPRGNTGGNCSPGGRVAGANGVLAGGGRSLGAGQPGTVGQIEVVIGGQTSIVTGEFSRQF